MSPTIPLFIMLHTETVEAETMALIRQLMSDQQLEDFFLVGGTALSLLMGHRKSIDIDLFNRSSFDSARLSRHLQEHYHVENLKVLKNGVFCDIDGVKVDMLTHEYKRMDFWLEDEGVRMESIKDLGAMKLNAIVGSGTRLKDFVDMYFLLECESLEHFLDAVEKKYPEINRKMATTALRYYQDIKPTPIVFTGSPISQQDFSQRFDEAVLQPHKVFDITPLPGRDTWRDRDQGFGFSR